MIKTDIEHLTYGEGSLVGMPFEHDLPLWPWRVSPVGRGQLAYLQGYMTPEHTPHVVWMHTWLTAYLSVSLLDIDPTYSPDISTPYLPLAPQLTGFVRFSATGVMFMYFHPTTEQLRLFVTEDDGVTWMNISPPLLPVAWTGHRPLGMLIGGPSLLTCFGNNCVMFATIKAGEGIARTWITTDGGAEWNQLSYAALPPGATIPAMGPTVIHPYISVQEQGELALLARNNATGRLDTYVTNDLGGSWQFRGVADPGPTIDDGTGFNQHTAYTGTYDSYAPLLPGLPEMMRYSA